MAGPKTTITKTQILAGPGKLYWDLAESATLPTDSEIGAPLSGTWKEAGATQGGLTITVQQSFFEIMVDQSPDPVAYRMTERRVQVATQMAEATLENLAVALNHDPATAIADIAGPPASRELTLEAGEDAFIPVELAIVVDGYAPGGNKMRRFVARRVNSVEPVGSSFVKDGVTLIPVTFTALYIDNVTSPVLWKDEM
jgi:hypothetical protein